MRAEKQYLISEVDSHLKKSDYVILANFASDLLYQVLDPRVREA